MADVRDELRAHLLKSRSAPFLFAGAGISRRYLGLDDWESLLRRMASLTGKDYDYYYASADGDFPSIATRIAEDLHDPWWHDDRFESSRERFKGKVKGRESALKAEASLYLADSIEELPDSGLLGDELDLLRKIVVDGVITTNFDPLLEQLFPDFRVFVGQQELLFEDPQGVGEIYKIHGSHDQPDSLVLTRADYDAFHERNPYLAAKLMTTFVEHPVVFLGYSLTDANVGSILQAIVSCLDTTERIAKLTDRLIFVQWDGGAAEPSMAQSVIPVSGNQIPVMTVTVPDFKDVYGVLGGLRRRFSAKLLRQLKEQVYELVLEGDPKDRLYVLPLDDGSDLGEVDVVIGVGAIRQLRSYVGLSREDLIADVIQDSAELSDVRVISEALPNILTHPGNVPVYKYLRGAALLDEKGDLTDPKSVDKRVAKVVTERKKKLGLTASAKKAAETSAVRHKTLRQMIKAEAPHNVLNFIPALAEEKLDPGQLKRFLTKHEPPRGDQHRSQWVKMVCLYDWLVYGKQVKPKKRRRVVRRKSSRSATSANGKEKS